MQNKNMLMAIALSVGFLFFWSNYMMPKYMPKPQPAPAAAPGAAAPGTTPTSSGATIVPAHGAAAIPTSLADTILRDANNEIVFAPRGGGVRHWRLKDKGQEADLVMHPDVPPLPLATTEAVFSITQRDRTLTAQADLGQGVKLTKTLSLSADAYLHDLTFRFENRSNQAVELRDFEWGWGPGLGTIKSEEKENKGLIRALSMGRLKVAHLEPGDYSELGQWAAIDNRYFLVAMVPGAGAQGRLRRVSG
jgi:hypothetical protein